MIIIYHNPRCSKSREALKILEDKGAQFETVKYMDHPLTTEELNEILNKLNIKPIDLVRTTEAYWKENYKGKDLSDKQIVEAIIQHPQLIQRPIIVNGDKAVIARPAQEMDKIL